MFDFSFDVSTFELISVGFFDALSDKLRTLIPRLVTHHENCLLLLGLVCFVFVSFLL